MRIQILAFLFSLVVFGSQGFLSEELVYAKHHPDHCCMCNKCKSNCWCGGQANCRICHTDDDDTILSSVSTINLTTINIRGTFYLHPDMSTASDMIEKVITHVQSNRLRESSTLKLVNHVDNHHMEFKCTGL